MTNLSAANKAKQDAAREADGKFGTQLHGEPAGGTDILGGAPERPEWLNGWPETLPVPELSFHVGEDNNITTIASVNGETFIEAWNPANNIHDEEYEAYVIDFETSEGDLAAAASWLQAKHEDIASEMRAEMKAAAERIQHRVLAQATGTVAPVSDEDLEAIVDSSAATVNQARKDLEFAATARVARGALEDHPTAATIVLDVAEVDDAGEIITGFTVVDEDGAELAEYDVHAGSGWAGYAAELPASNGWWESYTPKVYESEDDAYTIDLKAASAWTPGQI